MTGGFPSRRDKNLIWLSERYNELKKVIKRHTKYVEEELINLIQTDEDYDYTYNIVCAIQDNPDLHRSYTLFNDAVYMCNLTIIELFITNGIGEQAIITQIPKVYERYRDEVVQGEIFRIRGMQTDHQECQKLKLRQAKCLKLLLDNVSENAFNHSMESKKYNDVIDDENI